MRYLALSPWSRSDDCGDHLDSLHALKACRTMHSASITGLCHWTPDERKAAEKIFSILPLLRELPTELYTLQLLVLSQVDPLNEPSFYRWFIEETRWDLIQESLLHCSGLRTVRLQVAYIHDWHGPVDLNLDVR